MKVEVRIVKAGRAVWRHEFDASQEGDLGKAVGDAVTAFRLLHPEMSILDDDTQIILDKSNA